MSENSQLTKAESEILGLIAEGLQNKQIAFRRFTSERTVKNQACSIYEKLKAQNRVQAINIARARGLIK